MPRMAMMMMSDMGDCNKSVGGGVGAVVGKCKACDDLDDQENNGGAGGGHNGTAKTSSSASLAEVQKQSSSSSSSGTNGQTDDQQRRSTAAAAACDVTNKKQTMKMTTTTNAQLTDQQQQQQQNVDLSNHKPQQLQIGPEKEAQNSPKTGKSRHQFCKVFPDIAETDEVIKSYHCAFFRDILLQGFLYITPNWFCFYSKLLGKKCIKIPVSVVTNITKKKTAIIIPNAIRVITDTEKYVFGSLMSRDNTYQLMLNVWQEKRKVLQTSSIPAEQDGSDVNADLESVTSVGANNTSNTSSKDDFLVSSEGSFCSDLESTGQADGDSVNSPVDRLTDTSSPVPTANQKTASDCVKDTCPVFRCSAANPSSSVGTVPERLNSGVHSKTAFSSLNEFVNWILNFPRTCLLLTISTILVLFLLLSAMLLAYKLINLQMQLATYVGWSYTDGHHGNADATLKPEPPYREMLQDTYISRHDFHISNVEKIHVILESHVEVLNKVNQVLKELQTWAVNSCSSIVPVVENS